MNKYKTYLMKRLYCPQSLFSKPNFTGDLKTNKIYAVEAAGDTLYVKNVTDLPSFNSLIKHARSMKNEH